MANIDKLAQQITGTKRLEGATTDPSRTTTIYAKATSDSKDGAVMVHLSDNVTLAEGEDGTSVELPTTTNVTNGDTVLVTLIGETLTHPVVTGVVGSGDALASAATEAVTAADTAKTAAEAAQALAEKTEKFAWADNDGVHVSGTGDHDLSGSNILITDTQFLIRMAALVGLAISQNKIELGKEDEQAIIEMCKGQGNITTQAGDLYKTLDITAAEGMSLKARSGISATSDYSTSTYNSYSASGTETQIGADATAPRAYLEAFISKLASPGNWYRYAGVNASATGEAQPFNTSLLYEKTSAGAVEKQSRVTHTMDALSSTVPVKAPNLPAGGIYCGSKVVSVLKAVTGVQVWSQAEFVAQFGRAFDKTKDSVSFMNGDSTLQSLHIQDATYTGDSVKAIWATFDRSTPAAGTLRVNYIVCLGA